MIYNTFVGIDAAYKVPWTERFCNIGKCLCNQHLLRRKNCIETKKNKIIKYESIIVSRRNMKVQNSVTYYLLICTKSLYKVSLQQDGVVLCMHYQLVVSFRTRRTAIFDISFHRHHN